MKPLIIAYTLNVIDYLFTAYWVRLYGIEIESNPLARWMFEHDIAWAVKFFGVGALLALLGYLIHLQPKAARAAYIPLAAYAAVDLYHITVALQLVFSR